MPWFGSGKSDKPAAAAPAAGEEEHHDDEPAVGEVKYDPAKQTKVPRIDTGVPPANHTLRLGGETSSYDYVDARHFVVNSPWTHFDLSECDLPALRRGAILGWMAHIGSHWLV
eukprot:2193219-Rhodomonas_salina.1